MRSRGGAIPISPSLLVALAAAELLFVGPHGCQEPAAIQSGSVFLLEQLPGSHLGTVVPCAASTSSVRLKALSATMGDPSQQHDGQAPGKGPDGLTVPCATEYFRLSMRAATGQSGPYSIHLIARKLIWRRTSL
jgi:hypothetical protein